MTEAYFIIHTNEYGEELSCVYSGHDMRQAHADKQREWNAYPNDRDRIDYVLRDLKDVEDDAFRYAGTTRSKAEAECCNSLHNKLAREKR